MEPADGAAHYTERLVDAARHRHALSRAGGPGRRVARALRAAGGGAAAPVSAVAVQDPSGQRRAVRARAAKPCRTRARAVRRPRSRADRRTFARAWRAAGIARRTACACCRSARTTIFCASIACATSCSTRCTGRAATRASTRSRAACPIVTLPGRFMRGRQSAGMLALMGVDELVARDTDDYVGIVARLCSDAAWRSARAAAHRGDARRASSTTRRRSRRWRSSFSAEAAPAARAARLRPARRDRANRRRVRWRNRRAVGYHGLSSRSSSHRQSGTRAQQHPHGLPSAPARCARLVSTLITRSSRVDQRREAVEVVAQRELDEPRGVLRVVGGEELAFALEREPRHARRRRAEAQVAPAGRCGACSGCCRRRPTTRGRRAAWVPRCGRRAHARQPRVPPRRAGRAQAR